MKKTQYSAFDALEDLLSGLRPGTVLPMQRIIETIKPQYRDAQTVRTAMMLAKKYDIKIKKGE